MWLSQTRRIARPHHVYELKCPTSIVFTRTKHGANRVVQYLEKGDIRAAAIHGNKSQNARTEPLISLKPEKYRSWSPLTSPLEESTSTRFRMSLTLTFHTSQRAMSTGSDERAVPAPVAEPLPFATRKKPLISGPLNASSNKRFHRSSSTRGTTIPLLSR